MAKPYIPGAGASRLRQ